MRLTLRTLLAWKDGVLPPAEVRALDDKVAASPVAGRLLSRIDEVVARPQLGAARTDARGLGGDPLSVARYLDNTLPDDQLEPFELVCLESDLHLAEVASCHRILAALEREQGGLPRLDAASRSRLLAALAQATAAHATAGGAAGVESAGRAPSRSEPPARQRRRRPWLAWATAALSLASVALLVGVLVANLSAPPEREVRRPEAVDSPDAVRAAPDVAVAAALPRAPASQPRPAPADVPAPAPAAATGVAVSVPAFPDPTTVAAGEPPPGSEHDLGPPVVARVSGAGALVWRPAGRGGEWAAALPGAEIGAAADLVVPPGAEPAVSIEGITFRPLPGSRCVITVDAGAGPRLELLFGRCVVVADRPDAALRVVAAGLEGTLGGALASGVELGVTRLLPPGVDPATTAATVAGRLTALGGGNRLSIAATGAATPLEAGRTLAWDGADPGAATVVASRAPIEPESAGGARLARGAAAALAARLEAGDGIEAALEALAASRRAEDRVLAATTAALLGAFDGLVDLLVADGPPVALRDGQWEELVSATVPLASARGVHAASALRQAFESRGPPGRGALLGALVTGTDPELVPAPGALVDLLDDETLVIRRAAFLALCRSTEPTAADRVRYRPDSPPERRHDGVAWWRRQVDRRPAAAPPRE